MVKKSFAEESTLHARVPRTLKKRIMTYALDNDLRIKEATRRLLERGLKEEEEK